MKQGDCIFVIIDDVITVVIKTITFGCMFKIELNSY